MHSFVNLGFFVLSIILSGELIWANPEDRLFTKVGVVGNKILYAELLSLVTWKDAHLFCRGKDMFLASITSEAEKSLLKNYFTEVELTPDTNFWLSGTDYGSTGVFYWMDSGKLITDEPGVVGNDTCSDASTGGGYCSYFCSCKGKCSCGGSCSGKCVNFAFRSLDESFVQVDSCVNRNRFICQQLIVN